MRSIYAKTAVAAKKNFKNEYFSGLDDDRWRKLDLIENASDPQALWGMIFLPPRPPYKLAKKLGGGSVFTSHLKKGFLIILSVLFGVLSVRGSGGRKIHFT
jgi:hypothetical protein